MNGLGDLSKLLPSQDLWCQYKLAAPNGNLSRNHWLLHLILLLFEHGNRQVSYQNLESTEQAWEPNWVLFSEQFYSQTVLRSYASRTNCWEIGNDIPKQRITNWCSIKGNIFIKFGHYSANLSTAIKEGCCCCLYLASSSSIFSVSHIFTQSSPASIKKTL